jgi:hypothetical protein
LGFRCEFARIEMEMRFVVPPAASATSLAERLSLSFGFERISLLGDSGVGLRVESESDRAVVRAFEVVEGWLHYAAVGSAEMRLGNGSYRAASWAPGGVASWAPGKWWR